MASDETQMMQAFSRNLRRLRYEAGLSQFELSVKAEVTNGIIGGIELHKNGCNLRTAVRLARALGVTVDDMLK